MNTPVLIYSSIRSGSTLLKALLATRSDVTNLPEVDFNIAPALAQYIPNKITVFKKPNFKFNYPALPGNFDYKMIVLIRNPYDTILSIYKAFLETKPELTFNLTEEIMVEQWSNLYEQINTKFYDTKNEKLVVLYEKLIQDPIGETNNLFEFIGSQNTKGVDTYCFPKNFQWEWGRDDGGDTIKTLQVQNNLNKKRENSCLINAIKQNRKAQNLLQYYRYEKITPELFK